MKGKNDSKNNSLLLVWWKPQIENDPEMHGLLDKILSGLSYCGMERI